MSEGTVKRTLFARLLLCGDCVLREDEDCLIVHKGGKENSTAVSEMTHPVQINSSWLWSRLVIKTASRTFSYAGFKTAQLSQLADGLNIRLKTYAETLLETESVDLFRAAEMIRQFLNQQHYRRDSQRSHLVTLVQQATRVQSHPLWGFFATDDQRSAGQTVAQFINSSEQLVREANKRFVDLEIKTFKDFFDTIEKNPLTLAQREASVINEDNNLVLAGAGTGKTSTMIGRAGYLLASRHAQPDQLLMLAFAKKAAHEMQERQDKCLGPWLKEGTPTIKTFHALGLEIIKKVAGKAPDLSNLAEDNVAFARFIDRELTEQLNHTEYKSKVVRYFITYLYPYRNPFDFRSVEDYYDYVRRHELRTFQGEVVKSFEECEIANFLLQHSVTYLYEEPYIVSTAGPDFRQYHPDFFLPEYGIYIEHFALDKEGKPPKHFDQQRYLEGITWKRKLHQDHNTRLIETYSHLKREGRLQSFLAEQLVSAGVSLVRRSDEELLDVLRQSGNVSEFAKLLSEFLALFKQSYLKWEELEEKAKAHIDAERLCSLLDILKPIFEAYERHLQEHKQIDFAA